MKKIIILFLLILVSLNMGCAKGENEKRLLLLSTDDNSNTNKKNNNTKQENIINNKERISNTENGKNDINIEDNVLATNLKKLCESPRRYNTDGERRASDYLTSKMSEYGYKTSIQEFPVYEEASNLWYSALTAQEYFERDTKILTKKGLGKNIIATKENPERKKTIYLTAHYDTTTDNTGVIDNGSGVVVVLEIARQLKDVKLPVNLEIIFFSGEEVGLQGSSYFVSQLTKEERNNALGCINLDVVGQNQDSKVELKTYMGQINIMSILMDRYYQFSHGKSEASDHTSFYMAEIPVVYLGDNRIYTTEDAPTNPLNGVDIDKLKDLTKIICDFIMNIDLIEYNSILNNSYEKEYKELPDTKELLGYSLFTANEILKKNGAGSKQQYILRNDNNNQIKLTEEDNRFLTDDVMKEFEKFDIFNKHIKYQILNSKENITIHYIDEWVSYNYGILEGNISINDALELIEGRSEFTKDGTLFDNSN